MAGRQPEPLLKTEITEDKTVAWCGCKHSQNPPFCDGSHAKL
jgi:CDGSH-type Zn-finger protein